MLTCEKNFIVVAEKIELCVCVFLTMEIRASSSKDDSNFKCSVGSLLNISCENTSLTKSKDIYLISEKLSKEEVEILVWRTNKQYSETDYICSHHLCYFLKYFEKNQKSCCDPFKKHSVPLTKKKDLRIITLEKAKYVKENKDIILVPGKLLCSTCRKLLNEATPTLDNEEIALLESDEASESELTNAKRVLEREKLNETLLGLDVTPLKLQSLSMQSKKKYAKKKFKMAKDQVKKKLSFVLNVQESNDSSESDSTTQVNELKTKSEDLDHLVDAIKEKLKTNLTKREKIQILTITPKSWSRRKSAEKFNVSEYLVRKARTLANEKGILALTEPKHGRNLPQETIDTAQLFYEDDEFSYMLPGAKDKVSIKKNTYKQKRILLCNLEELFIAFKEKHPNLKIGLSKFCSLRPKWCVLAGSPGTHSVCVCLYHQNVELLANALNQHDKESIHIMMDKLVCDRQNRDCMLRRCDVCPKTSESLKLHLREILEDYDEDEDIKFSQWVSSDGRMTLQTMLLPCGEFIDFTIKKIESLIPHSYITKTQNSYMKQRKENLAFNEVLVLMDFAENYNFILQNEVQSYHWGHLSCSVHPVVIFSKNGDSTIKETSLCFISDDIKHDVPFVYSVQEKTIDFVKQNFPDVDQIEYFTDGCSAQYKNFKTMINLCFHDKDFKLNASWSFHATSHGKTICDGIGGTVKRTVTKKNLQSSRQSEQIINAEQMYNFCKSLFSKINFFFLKEEEIETKRMMLETRFQMGQTIPGTRSFHYFKPASHEVITAKRVSSDSEILLKQNIFMTIPAVKPNLNSFVACVYEQNWWIGMVHGFNEEEGDYDILFMHPHGPAETFFWPQKEDRCPVPPAHLLCVIDPPEVASQFGRSYKIDAYSRKEIIKRWNNFNALL